jgi:hypothetical protein
MTIFGRWLRTRLRRTVRRPPRPPHICRSCALPFVRLESSVRRGKDWQVVLRCANCGRTDQEVLDEETVDRLQEEIDRGTEQLVELLALVTGRRVREW